MHIQKSGIDGGSGRTHKKNSALNQKMQSFQNPNQQLQHLQHKYKTV